MSSETKVVSMVTHPSANTSVSVDLSKRQVNLRTETPDGNYSIHSMSVASANLLIELMKNAVRVLTSEDLE